MAAVSILGTMPSGMDDPGHLLREVARDRLRRNAFLRLRQHDGEPSYAPQPTRCLHLGALGLLRHLAPRDRHHDLVGSTQVLCRQPSGLENNLQI